MSRKSFAFAFSLILGASPLIAMSNPGLAFDPGPHYRCPDGSEADPLEGCWRPWKPETPVFAKPRPYRPRQDAIDVVAGSLWWPCHRVGGCPCNYSPVSKLGYFLLA
jgi:hypothetical protein